MPACLPAGPFFLLAISYEPRANFSKLGTSSFNSPFFYPTLELQTFTLIKQDTIRSIIDAARVDEVIADFVTLKKRGANFIGLCPFHNEKTPSFTVSPAKGIYKCFGCGKGGDSVRFMMDHDQLSYPEALRYLAGKYGIEVEESEESKEDKEADNLRESLYLVNSYAAEKFSDYLWNDEKGKAIALTYFQERGFDDKTIRHFSLGYCPDERNRFSQDAIQKGYKAEYLEKTGLSIKNDSGYVDRFWGRIMFPIHNLSGRIIGFGGRTLKTDKKVAKYVNSPESEIYNKSRELYGLFFSRRDIVKEDICYVVEGYTDVVSLFQSGITNTVAPLGTSFTEDQIKLIRRYTTNVVLLFDGDEAGIKATSRAIHMLLAAGLNVQVVLFPEGQDPDSYSKSHSDSELKRFLEENRKDFISFFLETSSEEYKNDPVKKAELIKTILGSIAEIPDHLLRSLFLKDFSQKTGINEQSAVFELNRIRKALLKQSFKQEDSTPLTALKTELHNLEEKKQFEPTSSKKEEKIVSYLIKYGSEHLSITVKREESPVEEMTMLVSEYIVSHIEMDEVKFRQEIYHRIYSYFRDKIDNYEFPDYKELLSGEDEEIKTVTQDFLISKYELSSNWLDKYHISTPEERMKLLEFIDRDMFALKLEEIKLRINEIQEKLKDADDENRTFLLKEKLVLDEARNTFSGKLGIIIS